MNKEQFIALGFTEEQATKAEVESKKELEAYVPKSKFDEVESQKTDLEKTVKERDGQLEKLKKSAGDNESLQNQIETLQKENKAAKEKYDLEVKELKINNAIKLAIADKAQDADLVASLFDKSKLILGDDGKITGLDEQLNSLKESKTFLFKPDTNNNDNSQKPGFRIGNPNPNPPREPGQRMSLKDAIQANISAQIQK